MEMILVDWTRMGSVYCLAGAVAEPGGGWRFVRPLRADRRDSPIRNTGWSPYLMDGRHGRWEVLELVDAESPPPQPPHLEDLWVRGMRSRKRLATPAERRAILEAGVRPEGLPLFGERLTSTRAAAYLSPGTGDRSLATFLVPGEGISFSVAWRDGAREPDCRVTLAVPGLEHRPLPVKDHFLLHQAETAGPDPAAVQKQLARAIAGMGSTVAVRLGLSRPYTPAEKRQTQPFCWLMADGFFSLSDPQP